MWKCSMLDFGSRTMMSNFTSVSVFPLKLVKRNNQTRGALNKTPFPPLPAALWCLFQVAVLFTRPIWVVLLVVRLPVEPGPSPGKWCSPVTHRVWLRLRSCSVFQSAPAFCNFLSSLFLCPRWSAPLWFSDSWDTKIHPGCVFMCVWCVINGVRGVYFHFLGRKKKIRVFALSLPFNLPCRMERLFNSSITRKSPAEHKRSGAQAGEAGDLDPPPPTSISL